jgi:hypothetical protein
VPVAVAITIAPAALTVSQERVQIARRRKSQAGHGRFFAA